MHFDGEIYTGAVFDVLEALLDAEGLTLDDCVGQRRLRRGARPGAARPPLGTNEFLTGAEDLPEIAQAFVLANEAGFDGADAERRSRPPSPRTASSPAATASSTRTATRPASVVPRRRRRSTSATRSAATSRITLHVVDADFEDLCTPITLLEPVPGDAADNVQRLRRRQRHRLRRASSRRRRTSSGCSRSRTPRPRTSGR